MKKLLSLLVVLCWATAAGAAVNLPAVFGDNMVLQRNANARIWGTSDAKEVTITASWSDAPVKVAVKNGSWSAMLPTPDGTYTPQTLRISDGQEERMIGNVLIGEVWICSGQSNMYMPLRGYTGQPVEGSMSTILSSPQYRDRIRMITIAKDAADTPQQDCKGTWDVPSPETAMTMSAAAYYFAQTLTHALDVPVGIVSTSWGGSKIEAWIDDATIRRLGYDVDKINPDPKTQVNGQCSKLYNGLIAPLEGFTARGFTWYQGEANRRQADTYAKLMQEMVALWRTQWGDKKAQMPFIYVQIAPHTYTGSANTECAQLVEAQVDALSLITNSAMVPTTDIGNEACIHPPKKREVGERMAVLALGGTYRMKLNDCAGVKFNSAEFADGKAVVTFDNARYGLTPENEEVIGFELAGKDGVFHPAVGRIVKGKPIVEVTSAAVAQPVAVRYAFRNYTPTNLANILGWPAFPFRSDRK